MKCEHKNCKNTATIKNSQYHPNEWFCKFHANKAVKQGRINRKLTIKSK